MTKIEDIQSIRGRGQNLIDQEPDPKFEDGLARARGLGIGDQSHVGVAVNNKSRFDGGLNVSRDLSTFFLFLLSHQIFPLKIKLT